MKVWYTTRDGGDGYASVSFFESQEGIRILEEADPETYGCGEGGSWFEVPDGTVISGIEIYTDEQCRGAAKNAEECGYAYFD
jgi:hypothetical protein